jgi:N-acetylglutamate synthase-like GNAT family acetyltransferase
MQKPDLSFLGVALEPPGERAEMSVRMATAADVPAIHRLIAHYAQQGALLHRPWDEILGSIGNFLIHCDDGGVNGCISLESYGSELSEIRSIAVVPESRGRGIGSGLIKAALAEAQRRETVRVFAVTRLPQLFMRRGFSVISRQSLTEKIDRDCQQCPKRGSCKLTAVIATIFPERLALPILASAAIPVSAT